MVSMRSGSLREHGRASANTHTQNPTACGHLTAVQTLIIATIMFPIHKSVDTCICARDHSGLSPFAMARIAIRHYGSDAPGIMQRRVEDQVRHGDAETAEFWGRMAPATSEILNGAR